jgi:thioredoxin-like negative regulator of GroEL
MQSQTYRDIIDDKIVEWQQGLEKLKKQMAKAPAEKKSLLSAKVEELRSAIDAATLQLYNLNEQETAQNTMEMKERILKIFSTIDKDFTEYEEKTPFML